MKGRVRTKRKIFSKLKMARKIEKSFSWLTILAICFLIVFGLTLVLKEIMADTAAPSVTVGNAVPTMGTIILNGGSAITVTENNYVTVSGTTTITDNNGYYDITSATATLYLNNTTTPCSSNPNWCYIISSCATSSCDGLSCILTCSADVWFVAEPSTASSSYSTRAWQMDVTIKDSSNSATSGTTSQELNVASYIDLGTTIPYSSVTPGATSSNINLNATNTGNYHIDVELSGVNMETGGATSSIVVGQQHYSSSTIGIWSSATQSTALSGSPSWYDVALPKPTATTSDSVEVLYWVISIPTSTLPGYYTGTNTIGAVYAGS